MAAGGQAIAGLGFSLIAVPFVSIATGPAAAVPTINLVAAALNVMMLLHERRGVLWRDALRLFLPAAIAIPLAAHGVNQLPTNALSLLNGVTILAGTALLATGARAHSLKGKRGAVLAGAASGALNVATSVGGPPAAMYAINADWPSVNYRPTLQAYFLGINIVSFIARGAPQLEHPGLLTQMLLATGVGWFVGQRVAQQLDEHRVRTLLLSMAAVGGLVALIRGAF